ncbi:hypothetical protein HRbin09_00135 [bacterium HR09]|nr:hypothetical protein HRbin09_00135 [bacterium HR09]
MELTVGRLHHEKNRIVLAGILFLLVARGQSRAVSMGLPCLTPDVDVLPLHGFRLDLGALSVLQMRSLRSNRPGDLWGPYLALTYGAAPNAELAVDGMIYKVFEPERGEGSSAVGDFAVWGKFILGEPGGHFRYGVRFGAKLPNTPSNKDFGTNQTDFFMHLFAGTAFQQWQVSAFGGIGILERPGGEESQDDVAMLGVLAKRPFGKGTLRLEAQGFTKSRIYGDNWAFAANLEWPLRPHWALLGGGQLSKGRFYGSGEIRFGLVARF